jgi:hypothetical protein
MKASDNPFFMTREEMAMTKTKEEMDAIDRALCEREREILDARDKLALQLEEQEALTNAESSCKGEVSLDEMREYPPQTDASVGMRHAGEDAKHPDSSSETRIKNLETLCSRLMNRIEVLERDMKECNTCEYCEDIASLYMCMECARKVCMNCTRRRHTKSCSGEPICEIFCKSCYL